MSIVFLLWSIFLAGWAWGVHNAFRDGEILGGIGKVFRKTLPGWIQSPTTECPICMCSFHGTNWFLIASFHFHSFPPDFFLWVLFVVSTSGFNYVIKEYLYP